MKRAQEVLEPPPEPLNATQEKLHDEPRKVYPSYRGSTAAPRAAPLLPGLEATECLALEGAAHRGGRQLEPEFLPLGTRPSQRAESLLSKKGAARAL